LASLRVVLEALHAVLEALHVVLEASQAVSEASHVVLEALHVVLASSQLVFALQQVVAPSLEVAVALRDVVGAPLDVVLLSCRRNLVTLKALANVSPGFALKPWVQKRPRRLFATLKGLRDVAVIKRRRNSFRVAPARNEMPVPRVAKAQRYHPMRAARTGTPVLGWN
jgi:hypothetical protein